MARRPYRIVFTRPPAGNGVPDKPGTIVKADLEAARAEAEAIARSGGTAEVHFVTSTGERELVATYPPVRTPGMSRRLLIRSGLAVLLVTVIAFWLARWLRQR